MAPIASPRLTQLRRAAALILAVLLTLVLLPVAGAQAATARVMLRVLVVTNGDPSVNAIMTALDREGVPYTKVVVGASGRPVIDAAFLADAGAGTANFQAVVLPNQAGGGLAAAEVAAISAYEATFGVRQVNAYDFPGGGYGLGSPTYTGTLDGRAANVTAPGLSGPYGYLSGSLTIDNFDADVTEVFGYLAAPATGLPAGQSFTPLINATVGADSGSIVGVYAHDGREELVVSAAFNSDMQWFNEIAPGLVTWMTRGIHLGYQRNYFAVHVDDVFLPDSRWSVSGNCTPGDDCVDPAVTTTDIRMTAADVARLSQFQQAQGFGLDMVYNGGGSDAAIAESGSDPLTTAFLAAQGQFAWINHTSTHPYLGCIQIAPTVVGQTWRCATSATETPRQDPEVPQTLSGGIYWASQAFLTSQIADNAAWGTARGLTNFDPAELVTGEHSGLRSLPQQASDNPFLAPALSAAGVTVTASDASREPVARTIGSATTLPRHPMNIYYNTATYQEQIDEYNWYYTSRANGGAGICEDNPATSTCITPLPSDTAASAKTSFDTYLQPLEVRNALRYVLANDPAPFYAHQSNLAEDATLYPVVAGVLDAYRSVYDAASTPVLTLDMTALSAASKRMTAWTSSAGVAAYVDADGVHVPAGATAVPLTVPAGTTGAGASVTAYAEELSGWTTAAVDAVTPLPGGGYTFPAAAPVAPAAPAIGTATAANASATPTWTAGADGGSPVTGYAVRVVDAASAQVGALRPAPAGSTSLVVTGLTNGTAYRFQVQATNAVGTGPFSALSNAVTPAATAPTGAPTVATRTPSAGASGASTANNITVRFSENVQGVSTSTFTLANTATGVAVPATTFYNATTFGAGLDPTSNLVAGTQYTATLTGGPSAIRDTTNVPLATTSWTFTTAGTAPSGAPTVTTRAPAASATGVATTANTTATFSESVTGVSGTTFTLRAGSTTVPAAVTYNATTRVATLDPTATLAASTVYTATLTGGAAAIRDTGGTPLATTTWTFTTAAATPPAGGAPTVTNRSPAAGATGASRFNNITTRFSENVTGVSGTTFTLRNATTNAQIAGVVSYNASTFGATFRLNASLAANTRYTVTLTGGPTAIRDTGGTALVTTSWSFTTGS